ncbi:hypothetical protein DY000_02062654 [Brassica cretica]|uniref:Uncharacterized protein n=1 Tax=Brassica cretica TaxID=69181 RepID=A0ABQ7AY67_BRACR|nr:hypothetical protein DY000_02062654 [Brassica cretica]
MNSTKQIDAERPRQVAPTSRSGLWERPGVVALIGRSGSVFGFHRDEMASDFSGSLQRGRSSEVALRGSLERPHGVAP